MGLNIKSFQEILRDMVDWVSLNTKRLIDFSPGSALRTILEAVSTELEEYYFKTYKNMLWAMENSIYEAFDFSLQAAVSSYGDVVLTFTEPLLSPVLVPTGTTFTTGRASSDSLYFQTTKDYLIPAGVLDTRIEVHCTTAGVIGNVLEDTITLLTNPVSSVSTITNPERFNTGKEEETLTERKQRFSEYIETRGKATIPSIEYGVKEVEEISGVWIDESQTGIIKVFCHDSAGNLTDDVKEKVIQNLYHYRAGGIPVFVSPIVKKTLGIELEVSVLPQYNTDEFRLEILSLVRSYFDNFVVSQGYNASDFNSFVRNIDTVGIKNCKVSTPLTDYPVNSYELIRSGDIKITLVSVRR
jgi:uncharacterized phage protein gp47/JayE